MEALSDYEKNAKAEHVCLTLHGAEYGLDEIEAQIIRLSRTNVAVAGRDERLGIWLEGSDPDIQSRVQTFLNEKFGLHHSLFRVHLVHALPLLVTGKKDYVNLMQQLG